MEKLSARIRRDLEQEQQLRDQNKSLSRSLYNIHSPTMPSLQPSSPASAQQKVAVRTPTVSTPATASHVDQGTELAQLHKLQSSIQKTQKEKQVLEHELQSVQNQLKQNQLEIKNTERQMKENRARGEDVRTELMLAEFKRDSARKELEQVLDAIERSRQELEMMETPGDEEDETDTNKGHKEQLTRLMAEREELRVKVKGMEVVAREKSELKQQLVSSKEELVQEQKMMRQRADALQEELESRETKLEESITEKDNLQKRIAKLENNYKQMEKDKNQLIKEKSKDYEDLKKQMSSQLEDSRVSSSKAAEELRQQVQHLSDQLDKAQAEVGQKNQLNTELQQQVAAAEEHLSQQQKQQTSLSQQQQLIIDNLSKEKTEAVGEVQQQAERSKQQALEEQRLKLTREHQQILGHTQQQLKEQLTDLYSQLTAREVELQVLRERVRSQEGATKQLGNKIRQEAQDKLHNLVDQERKEWERVKETELQHRLHLVREETQQTIKRLHEELSSERAVIEQQVRQMTSMKQEVDELRQEAHLLQREKMAALNETRDNADQQKQRELDLLRQQYENETLRSVHHLEEMLQKKDEEIHRLRSERAQYQTEQESKQSVADKQEQSLVSQINEECCLIGEVLGLAPRLSLYGRSGARISPKATLAAAMANLRASGEDLRKYVHELRQELENQRQASNAASKGNKEELIKMRQTMQQEKHRALEDLKDRLIKEHLEEVDKLHKSLGKGKSLSKALREKDSELREILRNMNTWKQQTTEKLAKKFQEEMSRELQKRTKEHKTAQREWQREKSGHLRDIDRLEAEAHNTYKPSGSSYGSPMRVPHPVAAASHSSPTGPDHQTLRMLRELQNQVKQLQMENMSLKRSRMSSSVPDLSTVGNTSFTEPSPIKLRQLELQLQQAETRIRTSEDRADKHEKLLNEKLVENSKLQSNMTQQAKELMQLERAYNKLQMQTKLGQRPASPGQPKFIRSTAI